MVGAGVGGAVTERRLVTSGLSSTSTSQPGAAGSKPWSASQRMSTRLRSDHHARITSRSTSVAVAREEVGEAVLVAEGQGGEVVEGVAPAGLRPVEHAGDLVAVGEDMGDLEVAVGEHRGPRPERGLGDPRGCG